MPEPRADMLPDASETQPEVVVTPKEPEPASPQKKEEPKGETEVQSEVPKGFVPYQALDEERIKRKDAEKRLRELESSSVHSEIIIPESDMSEEGKLLKAEIERLKAKDAVRETQAKMAAIIGKYPAILDKLDEFDEFRDSAENSGMSLETAAKAFVFEKELVEASKARKGLERPTHGDKTPPQEGYSAADIDRLMKTDYKKFEKLVRSGAINPDQIK